MTSVLVISGSFTTEDRYGIESGTRVSKALIERGHNVETAHVSEKDKWINVIVTKSIDVVVPIGFGPPCEDGRIHTICDLIGVPCAGPNALSGLLALDKSIWSRIVNDEFAGSDTVRAPSEVTFGDGISTRDISRRLPELALPVIVKTACGGSSDGLAVCETYDEAVEAVRELIRTEHKVVVQELETDIAAELSLTTIQTQDGLIHLPIVELDTGDSRVMGVEEKFGPTSLTRHRVPADIDANTRKLIHDIVSRLQRVIGAPGLSRTDMLILNDDSIVLLEQNAIPGLLTSSIACEAAAAAGIAFEHLCEMYLNSAFIRRIDPGVTVPKSP